LKFPLPLCRARVLWYDHLVKATVHPGRLSGRVAIPGSKSHTIRALLVASLAEGESLIRGALDSEDTAACVRILRDLGVKIDDASPGGAAPGPKPGDGLHLRVVGRSGAFDAPAHRLDCANSGTTLYLALSLAALQGFPVSFTGDEQLQRRSAGPLLSALESAGARVTREGTYAMQIHARNLGDRPVTLEFLLDGERIHSADLSRDKLALAPIDLPKGNYELVIRRADEAQPPDESAPELLLIRFDPY